MQEDILFWRAVVFMEGLFNDCGGVEWFKIIDEFSFL